MAEIVELLSTIRDFINLPRRQHNLVQQTAQWNILTSALDVVTDSQQAIDAYWSMKHDEDISTRYLLIYGLTQALMLQQYAVENICNVLGIKIQKKEKVGLKKIRVIRARSTGHPNKLKENRVQLSGFIAMSSVTKEGFDLHINYEDDSNYNVEWIDLRKVSNTQSEIHEAILIRVIEKLRNDEMKHRKKFHKVKLGRYFKNGEYIARKIVASTASGSSREMGMAHVKMLIQAADEFKGGLQERGLYDTHPMYEWEIRLFVRPLNELQTYFSSLTHPYLDSDIAFIFASFVSEQLVKLASLAKEIDDTYTEEL